MLHVSSLFQIYLDKKFMHSGKASLSQRLSFEINVHFLYLESDEDVSSYMLWGYEKQSCIPAKSRLHVTEIIEQWAYILSI